MKPLTGIRVIDLTMWAFCPAAAAVLASWGAEVLHVESPSSPDPMRLFAGGSVESGRAGWMFKHYNRGKKSIALDLATDEGQAILYDLVSDADVFVTSFLEKTRKKLRFDIDDLRRVNPGLVYAKGSGAGPLGPESQRGGYDGASWWNRGSLAYSAMRVTGGDRPAPMIGHGDGMSGLVFAGGIAAALLQRERTGHASVVDSSLLGTAMWFNGPAVTSSTFPEPERVFQSQPSRPDGHWTMATYETQDGRWIALSLLGDFQDEWVDLCEHLGVQHLADDPRFATAADRAARSWELTQILDEVFASRPYADWYQTLVTMKGVWAPVQRPDELAKDPQSVANKMTTTVDYPDRPLELVSPPILFDLDPTPAERAPDFGEHTDAILTSRGMDPERIDDLRARGIIG